MSPLPQGASSYAARGRTHRRTHLIALCVLALLATLCATVAPNAYAAKKPPSRVKLVSVIAATESSLTLTWARTKRTKSYEIDMATNFDLVGRTTRKIPATSAARMTYTITGLTTGQTYCFSIRGKRGKNYGKRSHRTCKPTVVDRGAATGAAYRVLTYNVCAAACKHDPRAVSWKTRSNLATSLILAQSPDVIALQEHPHNLSPLLTNTLSSAYAATSYVSAKDLLYRKSRFNLVRTDWIEMSTGKYAVWAELADTANQNKRTIFVSVHLTSGKSAVADAKRAAETSRLLNEIERINSNNVPVVYAGDFNSNKSRPDDAPADRFRAAGYYDSYDLAARLTKPNWNSASDFSEAPSAPRDSYTWGDHVDRVFVRPGSSYITSWSSPAVMVGNKYDGPMPSDHKPVVVSLWVNFAGSS